MRASLGPAKVSTRAPIRLSSIDRGRSGLGRDDLSGQVVGAVHESAELLDGDRGRQLRDEERHEDDACEEPEDGDQAGELLPRHRRRLVQQALGRPGQGTEDAREVRLGSSRHLVTSPVHEPDDVRRKQEEQEGGAEPEEHGPGEEERHVGPQRRVHARPAAAAHHHLLARVQDRVGEVELPVAFGRVEVARDDDVRLPVPQGREGRGGVRGDLQGGGHIHPGGDRLPEVDAEARQPPPLGHHERRKDTGDGPDSGPCPRATAGEGSARSASARMELRTTAARSCTTPDLLRPATSAGPGGRA